MLSRGKRNNRLVADFSQSDLSRALVLLYYSITCGMHCFAQALFLPCNIAMNIA
jgi:hypothetical protein